MCRYHLGCGDVDGHRWQVAVGTLTACVYEPDVGTVFPHDFNNYSGDGVAFIGLLSTDGDLSRSRAFGLGSRSACGAFFYFLFRDDVDGDPTRRIGGVCGICHRGFGDHGDWIRGVQVRARRFCAALRVCFATRIALVE